MALLPSPARLRRAVSNGAAAVTRRLFGIERTPVDAELRRVPDDLPRDDLFEQPLVCSLRSSTETIEAGAQRAVFRVVVRDAAGKRCPDLFVEGRIEGPERAATGDATTDLLGTAEFRMIGPDGSYLFEVLDIAAGALEWDREASGLSATATVG